MDDKKSKFSLSNRDVIMMIVGIIIGFVCAGIVFMVSVKSAVKNVVDTGITVETDMEDVEQVDAEQAESTDTLQNQEITLVIKSVEEDGLLCETVVVAEETTDEPVDVINADIADDTVEIAEDGKVDAEEPTEATVNAGTTQYSGEVFVKYSETDTIITDGVVLEEGSTIKVIYDGVMTRSLPPQITALTITTADGSTEAAEPATADAVETLEETDDMTPAIATEEDAINAASNEATSEVAEESVDAAVTDAGTTDSYNGASSN